jgi:ubiquinone biosynthesis protein COQ9
MAVKTRLELLEPLIHTWPDALAVMSSPAHIPASMHHLAELVDEMWWLAGDRSLDFNYYSKRMLLTGVYVPTEWY